MHTLILLTGNQGTGKSTLSRLIRNCKEIPKESKSIKDLKKEIKKEGAFIEMVTVTSQFNCDFLKMKLKNFALKHNLKFYHFNLE